MIVCGGGLPSDIKVMAKHTKKLVIIADFTKKSEKLTNNWKKGIPIEVNPKHLESVKKRLGKLFEREGVIRLFENGNHVIGWNFSQNDIYGEENQLDQKGGQMDEKEDGVEEEGDVEDEEEEGVDEKADGQSTESQEMLAKVNLFNETLKKIPGVIETVILTDSDAELTVIMGKDINQIAIQY